MQRGAVVESSAKTCLAAAEARMLSRFPEVGSTLAWHVKRGCRKSGRAVADLEVSLSEAERQDYCRRHVLVPVYLDICLHFRDVILPEAFEPCWTWAREQFDRCLAGDEQWFSPTH